MMFLSHRRRFACNLLRQQAWHVIAFVIAIGVVYLSPICLALASPKPNNNPISRIIPEEPPKPIPITVLSGFLGSGKTTVLQNILQNNEGLRIAVIVNDVASVNIDSKLVSNWNSAAGMVELQNGCACCSRSEELLASVAELVTLSDMRGDDDHFDHIVVEMSGVADPASVRSKFQEAALYGMPLLERVQLDTMVTLVDGSTFLDYLRSDKVATREESPELFYREGEEPDENEDSYEDLNLPSGLAEALNPEMRGDPDVEDSGVSALITSQTETADIIILNKVDLVENNDALQEIKDIVTALNPRAKFLQTTFGKLSLKSILGAAKGTGVVLSGVIDDHRDAVHAATCDDPECTDPAHSHIGTKHVDHDEHSVNSESSSHSHSHSHACDDPACTDPSHDHSHSHEHACNDPTCTDPNHNHDHATSHAGIGTFVFKARRPFHPARLITAMRYLPVKRGLPEVDMEASNLCLSPMASSILKNVVRSKGFAWCANSNVAALYLSHAGSSIDVTCLGAWWATLPRKDWPEHAVAAILQDYDDKNHDEHSGADDFCLQTVGDRRQELVFIGPTLSSPQNQKELKTLLEQCLLNDDEWKKYVQQRDDENALSDCFPNPIEIKVATF